MSQQLISLAQLHAKIVAVISQYSTRASSETCASQAALGRILAESITAPMSLPRCDLSAMDGYTLARCASSAENAPYAEDMLFTVIGESSAGNAFDGQCADGDCIRIMTGAPVPPCCDTVVMQENTQRETDTQGVVRIRLSQPIPQGKNIRREGEEITQGQTILEKGHRLSAADILLLHSVGIDTVSVTQPLTVGILSTGDELAEAGTPLTASGIYDANRPALKALLQHMPVTLNDYGILPDDLDTTTQTLSRAAQACDVIISSGGVSVGDYDYLRQAVETLGTIEHYKVAMKPGKPFVFGRIDKAFYFGLPGNPISTFIGFEQIVKPALYTLSNMAPIPKPVTFKATLTMPVKKRQGRADFQRAHISQEDDGSWQASNVGAQDSHRVKGLSLANALLLLSADDGDKAIGDQVLVQPLPWAFL